MKQTLSIIFRLQFSLPL
uniref:Uncharacterized protein n=1 Tax=Anguilla anguilla TaxID=7936 RepID=A0A0E9XK58_ANGAN